MDRRLRRSAVALAGAIVALAPLVLPFASPAEARSRGGVAGACRDDTGITVVVDQRAFGGAVEVRCAPQPVDSGFQALTKAGFTYAGTVQFPGLLCRIDGQPASDPCRGAPPAKAYWGYWHADRGGSWTYSTAGANRTPPPGSVEGWAFGDKARPGIDPPDPSPVATPTSSSLAPSPPTSRASTGGAAAIPPSTAAPPSTTASGGDDPPEAPAAASPSVAAQGSDAVAAPVEMGGAVGGDPPDPGAGSPMALLVTGALVAAAGAFAVQQRRARRRG